MKILVQYLAVGSAGFLGAIARLFVATVSARLFTTTFPIGTLLINLSGSFFLGWFLTIVDRPIIISDTMKLAVGVGFVGAYTTFSTFMFESDTLLRDGAAIQAMLNLIGSLVLGLLAYRTGMWLGAR